MTHSLVSDCTIDASCMLRVKGIGMGDCMCRQVPSCGRGFGSSWLVQANQSWQLAWNTEKSAV